MRVATWTCVVFIVILLVLPPVTSNTAKEDDALVLEHDLGLGTFSKHAKIQLPNARRKEVEVLSQDELEDADLQTLGKEEQSNHGLYKLRVKVQGANVTMVTGYANARQLKNAGLRNTVTLHCDEFGTIVAISVQPRSAIGNNEFTEFSTIFSSQTPSQAPVPDTAGFLNKLKEEKIRKEKAEKEPTSLFGKYWMYILPAVFLFMMSSASQQQQQGS